jgi:hypothetical protein
MRISLVIAGPNVASTLAPFTHVNIESGYLDLKPALAAAWLETLHLQ